MAASISSRAMAPSPIGSHMLGVFNVSFADVTTGTFTTAQHGFVNIIAAWFVNNVTEDGGLTKINSDGSSTVRGSVTVSGVTQNDTGQLFIIGN